MVKAIWNGQVIAESDQTEVIEDNHYFPVESVRSEYLVHSNLRTVCPWKGAAQYYHLVVGDGKNANAAWYYPDPKPAASSIKARIAFWKGVRIETAQVDA